MPSKTHTARLRAGCKVNLFLDILGRLPNGYHSLRTLLLPLPEPFDDLLIAPASAGIKVRCDEPGIDPRNNTLTKAYSLYAEESGFAPGLRITLRKGIPHGAGLGGGSADAAALLLHLQNIAGKMALPPDSLNSLAAKTGADVPFFLGNAPALASGIGEVLEPVAVGDLPIQGMALTLVCPPISISTAWAYAAWDKANPEELSAGAEQGLTASPGKCTNAPRSSFAWLRNSFEPVLFVGYPELAAIVAALLRNGAAAAAMSGSGSCLFGLFRKPESAITAASLFTGQGLRAFTQQF